MTLLRRIGRASFAAVLASLIGWTSLMISFAVMFSVSAMIGVSGGMALTNLFVGVGAFSLIFGVPIALVIGFLLWLGADILSLESPGTGMLAGIVVTIPFIVIVREFSFLLIPIGGLSGFLTVRYTNRWLPKHRTDSGRESGQGAVARGA